MPLAATPRIVRSESPATSGAFRSSGRAVPTALLVASLVAFALLYPTLVYVSQGLLPGLTTMNEESVGRRYFYSLRILYGNDEQPWLPQGQLAGLTHHAMQLALTALGYPVGQIEPRVHYWTLAAIVVPALAMAGALWWCARALGGWLARAALGAGLVALAYDRSSLGGVFLIMPDYYGWAVALALVAAGWLLRRTAPGRPSAPPTHRDALVLGLFGGLCLAGKPSYAVLPLAVGLYLGSEALGLTGSRVTVPPGGSQDARRLTAALRLAVVAIPTALACWLALTWLYHAGSWPATLAHYQKTASYAGGAEAIASFSEWLAGAIRSLPPDAALLSLIVPAMLCLSILTGPRRALSAALLAGALLSVVALVRRFYHPTMVETNAYLLLVIVVWGSRIVGPDLTARLRVMPSSASRRLGIALTVGLMVLAGWRVGAFTQYMTWGVRASAETSRTLTAFVAAAPGRTLFAYPDNAYRTVSLDSAIRKGGTDPQRTVWADSQLVLSITPHHWFLDGQAPTEVRDWVNHPRYDQVVFVADLEPGYDPRIQAAPPSPRGVQAARARLATTFGISTVGMECPVWNLMVNWYYAIGCRFRSEPLAEHRPTDVSAATLVRQIGQLDGDTLDQGDGPPRPIAVSELFLALDRGALLRREPDGGYTMLTAPLGTTVPVVAPAGSASSPSPLWLRAVWTPGGWRLDPRSFPAPVIHDAPLAPAKQGVPSRWSVSTDTREFRAEPGGDPAAPSVRLAADAPASALVLHVASLLPAMDGVPALVTAQVRGQTSSPVALTLHDARCGQPADIQQDRRHLSEDWQTLTVWTPALSVRDPADHLTIGIVPAAAGDWFEVRALDVAAGTETLSSDRAC